VAKEKPLFTYGKYGALGFEFAAATIGGIFLGSYIDSHFGTGPWGTMLGAIAGMAGAIYRLVTVLQQISTRRGHNDRKD